MVVPLRKTTNVRKSEHYGQLLFLMKIKAQPCLTVVFVTAGCVVKVTCWCADCIIVFAHANILLQTVFHINVCIGSFVGSLMCLIQEVDEGAGQPASRQASKLVGKSANKHEGKSARRIKQANNQTNNPMEEGAVLYLASMRFTEIALVVFLNSGNFFKQ